MQISKKISACRTLIRNLLSSELNAKASFDYTCSIYIIIFYLFTSFKTGGFFMPFFQAV